MESILYCHDQNPKARNANLYFSLFEKPLFLACCNFLDHLAARFSPLLLLHLHLEKLIKLQIQVETHCVWKYLMYLK